jgi:N-succinyldiaminopimelate aminotransferase
MTGWKVGFTVAAPALMTALARAHQFLTFTTPPSLQAAVAHGLINEQPFLDEQRQRLAASRTRFVDGVTNLGFEVLPSAATYFVNPRLPHGVNDQEACLSLVREPGVAAIPVSAFYAEDPVTNVIRFCFAKSDATLDAALERLARWRL